MKKMNWETTFNYIEKKMNDFSLQQKNGVHEGRGQKEPPQPHHKMNWKTTFK